MSDKSNIIISMIFIAGVIDNKMIKILLGILFFVIALF